MEWHEIHQTEEETRNRWGDYIEMKNEIVFVTKGKDFFLKIRKMLKEKKNEFLEKKNQEYEETRGKCIVKNWVKEKSIFKEKK